MNEKLSRNNVAEFDRYYTPNGMVVSNLPDPRSVRDFTEVFLKTGEGTYDSYRMVEGHWVKTNSNLATFEEISGLFKTGGSGTDPSPGTIHDYVEIEEDYDLGYALNNEYKIISVKNISDEILTVSAYGSETIDGESSQDIGPDDCLTIMSNNDNWIIV